MQRLKDLLKLSETDFGAYRAEIARLRYEEPEEFAKIVRDLEAQINAQPWSRQRRKSSIQALALGDVEELIAKRRAQKIT